MNSNKWRVLVVAIAVITLSSCAQTGTPPVQIGLKRVAVDLTFKDETKAPPSVVNELIPQLIQPAGNFVFGSGLSTLPRFPAGLSASCPKADPAAVPEKTASVLITQAPAVGTYLARISGKVTVSIGGLGLTLQGTFPATVKYSNVKKIVTPGQGIPGGPHFADSTSYTFDYSFTVLGTTTTDSFLMTQSDIQLVQQVVQSSYGTTTFTPTSPMTWYQMKGEGKGTGGGDQWTSAGFDPNIGESSTISGSNVKREQVDLCGAVFDSYRVEQKEHSVIFDKASPTAPKTYDTKEPETVGGTNVNQTANDSGVSPTIPPPAGGAVSNPLTRDGSANVYNIATQLGGLILSAGYHYTQVTTVPGPGGAAVPFSLDADYDLVLLSATPLPLGKI
jgi:hypothetical protein